MAKMGRPPKFQDLADLQAKIDKYFDECDQNSDPYTITGLALALDTWRSVLCDYENSEDKEFSNTIKKAKARVENFAEKRLYQQSSPAGPIFALKNFGWTDRLALEGGDQTKPIRTENKHDIKSVARDIADILE
jgi:hypothetical protein